VQPTILLVDDEPRIARIARDYLEHAGYAVVTAGDGQQALELARAKPPSLVVLDLNLPGVDGLQVARLLRRDGDVPIIMLTARVEEADRITGLEIGADDYITKPFSPRELVARVKAVLRRTTAGAAEGDWVRLGDLTLDVARLKVTRGTTSIDLTPAEFQLLLALARQPGRILTRTQLLRAIGGESSDVFDRAIDTHVKNIRRKLEPDPREPQYILTVYGVGYKFRDE
jgi:two-component system, OmpR family, alkaline phosphatase synthesis response regulator PhoP